MSDQGQKHDLEGPITPLVDKMGELDRAFTGIEKVFAAWPPTGPVRIVGDWAVMVWADHRLNNDFSMMTLERVGTAGAPFPAHGHPQPSWIFCVRGRVTVQFRVNSSEEVSAHAAMGSASHVYVPAAASCVIHPSSADAACVVLTIPADPGFASSGVNDGKRV